MKLSELKEMAHRSGDLKSTADAFAAKSEPLLKDSKHVGDIEEYVVRSDGEFYSVWTSSIPKSTFTEPGESLDNYDEMVAMVKVVKTTHDYVIVDALWTKREFRGKKIMAKLLWFLKSRENYSKMLIGIHHSDDTYNILKSGGLSKFKHRYWFDPKSGSTEEFDPSTIDNFYSSEKSKWSLMLEERDDGLTSMPHFNTMEAGFSTQAYEWQIE